MHVAATARVRCPSISILVVVAAACNGNLKEKVGQSNIDAPVLNTINPPPCDMPTAPTDGTGACTGTGKPGDDCLMCHHQGGGATPFTFAGTLYDTATGQNPVANATIYLEDSFGNIATTLTHANGNFYSTDGFVMYPAKAFVSLCPNVLPMVSPVDTSTGANCNTASCHTSNFRVHLP
jgi:hypothetical protein